MKNVGMRRKGVVICRTIAIKRYEYEKGKLKEKEDVLKQVLVLCCCRSYGTFIFNTFTLVTNKVDLQFLGCAKGGFLAVLFFCKTRRNFCVFGDSEIK